MQSVSLNRMRFLPSGRSQEVLSHQGALVLHQAGPSTVLGVVPWLVDDVSAWGKEYNCLGWFYSCAFRSEKKMDGNTDRWMMQIVRYCG